MSGKSDKAETLLLRQKILADFGDLTLQCEDLDAVLTEACRLVGEALGTGRAKVLEIEPRSRTLLVRAGVGWGPGVVGVLRLSMDKPSSESFSIEVGEPVISRDIREDHRFEVPAFMREAGVVALANVPIFLPGRTAYGLLEVDDTEPRDFDEDDAEFLRTYAMLLGPVIDRLLKVDDLRASQERFRLTVEAATDYAILITDQDDRVVDWLPGAAAVFGWSAEEILGQPAAILFTPEDRATGAPEREVEIACRTGYAADVRWHLRKDGSRVFIEGVRRTLHDAQGELNGFIKIGQDVTARRATEELLRESEERFRSFAEASSDVLWIVDAETRRLEYLSPAYERIWGEGRDAILADLGHWATTVLPEDLSKAVGVLDGALNGQRSAIEYRIRRPDGGMRHIHDTGFPISGEDGQVRRVGGIAQDLTARRRAESALESSERQLRTLMEGIPQLVWRSRDRGEWTWSSPQWQAFTGQTQTQSQGRGWFDAVHPDDHERTEQAWKAAQAQGRFEFEYRVRRASDGAHLWHHTRAVPVRDDAAGIVEWLGTSTEVQEMKELQERQEVMVHELQHRTRNLITVVGSVARQTMARTGPTEAFREAFSHRLEALARVQGLLSRAEQEPITIRALVQLELDALGAAEGERVTLAGPPVRIRPTVVQTLALGLHELATNARKYGALSVLGGRLAIEWKVRTNGGERRLLIDWQEAFPPRSTDLISAKRGGGYGRRLLERALPYALDAQTTYDLKPTGLRCTIDLPLDRPTGPGRF